MKQHQAHYLQNIPGLNINLAANDPNVQTIKQHYYPEGGWGWVIVIVVGFVHFATACFSASPGLLAIDILETFAPNQGIVVAVILVAFSTMVTLIVSPLVVALCRRKSTRLIAILGGLITALGCLFSSFATQFHQLFFSYGLFIGVGSAMIRDPAVIMVGQYFKKRRELVEIFVLSGQGLGIALMPLFITHCIRSRSWRFGLQCTALVTVLSFFLAVLYRPASLYHPQRRAILHLKSLQKRSRLKDQHLKTQQKASIGSAASTAHGSGKAAYFDFSVLRSRTIQIILSGTCISNFGLLVPLFLIPIQCQSDGIKLTSVMNIQLFLGLGFVLGVIFFGLIVVKKSTECLISRQYLCQTSAFVLSASLFALAAFQDYFGYLVFVCIFGFFLGGHIYSLKLFVYEKVRARNFNRTWGFVQMSQSIPILAGMPITLFLNEHYETRSALYLSASCVALGSSVLFFIDAHKKSLARKRQTHSSDHQEISEHGPHVAVDHENHSLSVAEDALALAIDSHQQRLMYLKSLAAARQNNMDQEIEFDLPRLSPFAAKADFMRGKSSNQGPANSLLPPGVVNAELTRITEEEAILENFLEDCVWNSCQMSHNNKEENNYLTTSSLGNHSGKEDQHEVDDVDISSSASVRTRGRRPSIHSQNTSSLRDLRDDCLINSNSKKENATLNSNEMQGKRNDDHNHGTSEQETEEYMEKCPCCKRLVIECDVELSEEIYERAPVIFEQSSSEDDEQDRNDIEQMVHDRSDGSHVDSIDGDGRDGDFDDVQIRDVLSDHQIAQAENTSRKQIV